MNPQCLVIIHNSMLLRLCRLALVFLLAASLFPIYAEAQIVHGQCLQQATGLNNPGCSANDVRITRLDVLSGPTTCTPGDTLNLSLKATIESGPARYDVGIWLNETGGSARTDATGTCYRNILSPISTFPGCNQAGGPYLNADADACGDVPAVGANCSVVTGPCTGGGGTCTFSTRTFNVSVLCKDSDNDGRADVSTCTSWDNNTNTACANVGQAVPGTGSKCNCSTQPIGQVAIDVCGGVSCGAFDTACATASCNPVGAPGNCSTLTPKTNGTLCRASTGACDAAESCNGVSTSCPADGFQPQGTTCGDQTDTACNNPNTCDGNGSCQNNLEPTSTQCRGATGECDTPEFCDGAGSCPADSFVPQGTSCGDPTDTTCNRPDTCNGTGSCQPNNSSNTTTCRQSAGACDVPELCDGAGSCPADSFQPSGTTCGDQTSTACNQPDTCNATGSCQPNNSANTTTCRPSTGACDVPELCDGSGSCPTDAFQPTGTTCGDQTDTTCNKPDSCNGTGSCQPNNSSNTTTCRESTGQCDVPELCDGSGSCPTDAFQPTGTTCGDQTDSTCNKPDSCNGTGSCQPNNSPNTTTCRQSTGECDLPELCDGAGSCPTDAFQPTGTTCGDQTETTCSKPDSCSGQGTCQPNNEPITKLCRESAGECDAPENCDGAGSCPTDGFQPNGTTCGDSTDTICNKPDTCTDGACQPNNAPGETVCRESAGDCDVPETCDSTGNCPVNSFKPAESDCGSSVETVCDSADVCDSIGNCLPNYVSDTHVCRAATGDCDISESCDGAGNCPTDSTKPDGTACSDIDDDSCSTAACANGTCDQTSQVVTCADSTCEECNTSSGICGPKNPLPLQCSADIICRSPGFYGTHADDAKKKSKDITGAIIAAAGGSVQVCGLTLDNTLVNSSTSAQEALCVSVQGNQKLQLIRQLTAMTLNCVVSGSAADCSNINSYLAALYTDCNQACAGNVSATRTIGQCVREVDCFNNGGQFVNDTCFLGVCSDNGELCNSNNISACEVTSCDPLDLNCHVATCGPIPGNCHDRALCLDSQILPNLCFEPTGPAGSSADCNKANTNKCVVSNAATCSSSGKTAQQKVNAKKKAQKNKKKQSNKGKKKAPKKG